MPDADDVLPRAQRPPDRTTTSTVDWASARATTRWRPTVTTFGWRGKLLLTTPPVLVLAFWTCTVFGNPLIAMAFGIPMLAAVLWWVKQVWVAGPDPEARPGTVAPVLLPEPPRRRHPGFATAELPDAGQTTSTGTSAATREPAPSTTSTRISQLPGEKTP